MEKDEYKIMHDLERDYWWFKGKQYLVGLFLKLQLKKMQHCKLLDIGSGTGAILELLSKNGVAVGLEVSPLALKMVARENLGLLIQADANKLMPFKDNVFSAITCLDVLEHLKNDFNLVQEMLRVCKPGGIIIITVPAMKFIWSAHDEALHHFRRYTRSSLLNQFSSLNFRIIKASYFNMFLFFPIAIVRKIKGLLDRKKASKSDFFMPVPECLNKILSFCYFSELNCLRFLNMPFGLSVLLIIRKPQ